MTIRTLVVSPTSDLPETHQLIGLHREGVKLQVLRSAKAPNAGLLDKAGIENRIVELESRWDKNATAEIRSALQQFRPHILHMLTSRAVQNGLRASKGIDVRLLAYRGIEGVEKVYDPISWMTYLSPRIDRIACVADAIRRHYLSLRLPGWRFPRDKAITIYKGHDLDWYRKAPVPREQLNVPENAVVVACTVNDRPRKGLHLLLEACQQLRQLPDLHFLLMGNIDISKYRELLQASGMQERIHFTGFRNDVPQVMASCDMCILPAFKREGLPRGIIEGMVNGVAPLVADAGGSPELIEHGVSGVVFAPSSARAIADAILPLYENPGKRIAMGQAARERIQTHFHVSATVEKTLQLYQELAAL